MTAVSCKKARAEQLPRLATVWPQQTCAEKWAAAVPLLGGRELSLHLTQCGLGQGLPPYQVTS